MADSPCYVPGLISAILCGDNSLIDTTDKGTAKGGGGFSIESDILK